MIFNRDPSPQPSPHPNSALAEFGTLKLAQVGYIRLRLGRGSPGIACFHIWSHSHKREASAADLKFLLRVPHAPLGTSNRKAALES